MHSDEKADVNELLVQLDRVSRLGRLVVGTTNFVDSLDDAVVRSGRFGRFLPVPPPDIDASVAILDYYLKRLPTDNNVDKRPGVQVPESTGLRNILEPLFAENIQKKTCFCGADLEAAVIQTYERCVRQAIGDKWPEDYASIVINLSQEELARSLLDVPRSVTEKAAKQFLKDINRYCGSNIAKQIGNSLGVV